MPQGSLSDSAFMFFVVLLFVCLFLACKEKNIYLCIDTGELNVCHSVSG